MKKQTNSHPSLGQSRKQYQIPTQMRINHERAAQHQPPMKTIQGIGYEYIRSYGGRESR